jgi:hypothetical protein
MTLTHAGALEVAVIGCCGMCIGDNRVLAVAAYQSSHLDLLLLPPLYLDLARYHKKCGTTSTKSPTNTT